MRKKLVDAMVEAVLASHDAGPTEAAAGPHARIEELQSLLTEDEMFFVFSGLRRHACQRGEDICRQFPSEDLAGWGFPPEQLEKLLAASPGGWSSWVVASCRRRRLPGDGWEKL